MKKAALLTLLTFALAAPLLADDEDRERHQSYLSYDDGGTMVRSGEDGREIEAHRNLPIYPGDEVTTSRRGRAEVRLSDGNIVGIDRATALRFLSVLDSYEGEDGETVAELKYGKVAIHRTDIGRDHVRLDTENASYLAEHEGVYSVETDPNGADRVTVFDGSLEVRTRTRTTRLREGETATVDDKGVYDLAGDQRASSDDFERWFLKRAERFGSYNSRYMDRRLSYWSDDLDDHGRWVYVTGIGYSWRPYVTAGWRPYYNGYWHTRNGCLTWVSYDPWGWGTYHYGRWAYDPGFGWVWVPGYGYSPAWVYWMYGSGYVGWAPSGWWDCHRPYYNWAYNPYRNYGHGRFGFGFYGRVRVSDLDLRPWTFVDSRGLVSNRVDRAALNADAVRDRLGRARDGFATVSGGPARFTREEWNDPADAIRRRSIGGVQSGRETGAPPTDMTPYFRRDGDVGGTVRDRVIRAARGSGGTSSGPTRTVGGGSVAPIGGGSVAPIGRGSVSPIEGRRSGGSSGGINRGNPPVNTQPVDPGSSSGSTGRGIDRGREVERGNPPADTPSSPGWRNRGREETPGVTPSTGTSTPPDGSSERSSRNESWRSRVRNGSGSDTTAPSGSGSSTSTGSGSSAPSRRVIDGIGGPRISRGSGSDSSRDRGSSTRSGSGSGSNSGSRDRSSGSSVSRDSGRSSSGSGSSASRDSGRSSSGSGSGSSSGSSSSGRSSGKSDSGSSGRVKRD